jgi:opacity protein-like surface antigen
VAGTGDVVFNYLEIPILVKVALGSGDIQPYVFAGPSVGILLSATSTSGGTSQSVDSTFSTLNLSLPLGAGVSYKLAGGISLFLDAAYEIGILNILKNTSYKDAKGNSVSQSLKTNDIRIGVGAMFPI